MKPIKSYHVYALTTIILWSSAFMLSKLSMKSFSAYSLGFLRYFFASLILIAIAIKNKIGLPDKKDLPVIFFSGFTGFFTYMIAFNIGNSLVSSATASIILAIAPILAAVFARIAYKDKLKTYQWISIGIEFAGILALTLLNGVFSINKGVLWMISAAILLGLFNVTQKKIVNKYSSIATTTYTIVAGTILLAVFAPNAISEMRVAQPSHILYVILLSIFPSVLAYLSWAKAFSLAEKTPYVTNYMFTTPFFATLIGFIVGKEIPGKETIIGGSIILSGILLFNKENLKRGEK
ncbi:MAG: DMT family transporter [Lachnospiraceae bacterium]|nr:DMT family transporter [Lachnospiraceae bacterium]